MADDGVATLKRYCVCIIEFLSSQAIDPHLYFKQQMTGEVEQTETVDELVDLMRRLISWVDTMAFRPAQGDRLNALLSSHGFPPLAVIRKTADENIVATLAEPG